MTMKNRYMARKFLIAMFGMVLTLISVLFDNTVGIISGSLLGISFILGESVIDACATVKKEHTIMISETKDSTLKE